MEKPVPVDAKKKNFPVSLYFTDNKEIRIQSFDMIIVIVML